MSTVRCPSVRPHLLGRLAGALLAVSGLAMQASAQDAEAFGVAGPAAPAQPKPAPRPLSESLGVNINQAPGLVVLPLLNNDALVDEDAAFPRTDKVLRFGVGQDVPFDANQGTWYAVPEEAGGGLLWVCDFASPGAQGMRLHLSQMDLPEDAQLVAYAPNVANSLVGPYSGRGLLDSGEMWTGSVFRDVVRVELHLPGKPVPNDVPFRVDSAQHFYRDLAKLRGNVEEGNCYNDSTCFPAWANNARAEAGIGFIQNNVSLYCSGTLLNPQNGDLTPYWLTANHCLSTNGAAQSSEIFWFFQTSSCNGAPPSLASVQRSAVCTLLSTNSASDYTLLMVEGTLPGNSFWAGWNSGLPADGAGLTGIHHPGGAYKRISFATKQTVATCSGFGPNHIRTNWVGNSVTEPGSSGSGLFRNDTQQLIGQLHGGPSACGNAPANQWDCYGSFAVTYPNISGLLTAGSDDVFEPNDSCAAARDFGSVGTTSNSGLIVKSASEDWYKFTVPGAGGRITIDLGFRHAFGDIDMQLLDGCGSAVVISAGTTDSEHIDYINNGATRTFTLHVYLFSDTRNTYNLSTSVIAPAPLNDNCGNATPIGTGSFSGFSNAATTDGSTSCGFQTTTDVWYSFTAPASGTLSANTCGSSYDTVLSVHTGCPGTSANVIACDDDSGNCGAEPHPQSALTANVVGGQTYLIRLAGYNGAVGAFTLNVGFAAFPGADNCASAPNVAVGTYFDTNVGANTDGAASCVGGAADKWYAFTAPGTGTLFVNTCGSAFDTVLSVHTGCPGSAANSIACDDDSGNCGALPHRQSSTSAPVVGGQTYLIRVGSFIASLTGNYQLNIGFSPVAPSDTCASAPVIAAGTYSGTTVGATQDGSTNCGAAASSPDVWYAFPIGASNGTLHVDLCGSSYDTVVSLHNGCDTSSAGYVVACNDDFCGLQSQIDVPVAANTTYLIRVAGFFGQTGAYAMHVSFTPATGADTCGSAPAVVPGTFFGSNAGATQDGANSCRTSATLDVWFSYFAPANGTMIVDTCGSALDTVVSIHSGCPGTSANELACNDDDGSTCPSFIFSSRVSTHVSAGSTYLIRLAGYNGAVGAYTMHLAYQPPCAADFNGDGFVDPDDLSDYIGCYFSLPPCDRADYNGDGFVDPDDLSDYIGVFFAGCP